MAINLTLFLLCGLVFYWYYKNIKKEGFLWIVKVTLQVGILILFVGGFLKLFANLPSNPFIKLIFFLTYIWCTVGINVNFMIPLIGLINQKIDKNK